MPISLGMLKTRGAHITVRSQITSWNRLGARSWLEVGRVNGVGAVLTSAKCSMLPAS